MEINPLDQLISIRPFDETNADEVIRIHQDVLEYTFNSLIGKEHLRFIYSLMARGEGCYVGVAYFENHPVGVVSGTVHLDQTKALLRQSLTAKAALRIAFGICKRPYLLSVLKNGDIIARPIAVEDEPVNAILTTIAVSKLCQRQGVGKHLVFALENYFIQNKVNYYRLDTLIENDQARQFYKALGFREMESRVDSVILTKRITL